MSSKKRVDLSTRVGADFFRSDKGAKVDIESYCFKVIPS